MNQQEQAAFAQGFVEKCAQYGVDPELIAKEANLSAAIRNIFSHTGLPTKALATARQRLQGLNIPKAVSRKPAVNLDDVPLRRLPPKVEVPEVDTSKLIRLPPKVEVPEVDTSKLIRLPPKVEVPEVDTSKLIRLPPKVEVPEVDTSKLIRLPPKVEVPDITDYSPDILRKIRM